MSFNGNGVFLINTPGQPVVSGTTITSTAFNALTTDLASGLTNTITKDGQTNITANIPMSNFKITGLGAATNSNDAVRLAQIQDGIINGRFINLEYSGTLTGGTGVVNIGSGQLYKDASGNIGIGTTSPAYKVSILGTVGISEDLLLTRTDANGPFFGSVSAVPLRMGTGGTERARLDNAGNLGIGTDAPTSKLDVVGAVTVRGGLVRANASGAADSLQLVGGNALSGGSGAAIVVKGALAGTNPGGMEFYTGNTVTTNERIRINEAGDVGIGTTSLVTRLQINSNTNTNCSIILSNQGTNVGTLSNEASYFGSGAGSNAVLATYSTNSLLFATNSLERMRVNGDGNVSISTTTTIGRFTVKSDDAATAIAAGNVSGTAAYNGALFYNNGFTSLVGQISIAGSTASYLSVSDYRLKDDVTPMTGALATVAQLKPVTYKWKSDGSDGQGFIAHELQAVVPDCVTGDKDAVDDEGKPKYQGVDTSFLVATLTAAIQEQQAIISAMETRLAALEA